MPAWKTYDEATADALKEHFGNPNLATEVVAHPLFEGGDSVVLAPTLQKGAVLVITARKKAAQIIEERPVALEESTPAALDEPQEEPTFGPTTWERTEQGESPLELAETEFQDNSANPGVWDLPSPPPELAGPSVSRQESAQELGRASKQHYVATGFLGLDDYAEDEEELARARRPWWKKIFID